MNYEPWQHLVIEDFLPKKEFEYHCWRAQQIDIVDNVNRHFLDYDPFPRIQWLKDDFDFVRSYDHTSVFVHYAATKAGFHHPRHVDSQFKIMSAVLYLSPEENHGTDLFRSEKGDLVTSVEWKPNTLFVFCGRYNHTWHDYRATSDRYTLNWFLVDPLIIENEEYKKVLVTDK